MAKNKKQCPTCKTATIALTLENWKFTQEIKMQYHLRGKTIPSIEKIINDVLKEYRFIKDSKVQIV